MLELRKYKNNFIQPKKIPILKLPLFFITYTARKKVVTILKLDFFRTVRIPYYNVLAFIRNALFVRNILTKIFKIELKNYNFCF